MRYLYITSQHAEVLATLIQGLASTEARLTVPQMRLALKVDEKLEAVTKREAGAPFPVFNEAAVPKMIELEDAEFDIARLMLASAPWHASARKHIVALEDFLDNATTERLGASR